MYKTIKQVTFIQDPFIIGDGIKQHFSRQEVEGMLEKTRKDAYDEGFKEGHAKGFQDGEAKAHEEAKAALDRKIEMVESIFCELDSAKPAVLSRAQEDMLRLAMIIAAKIIHREVKQGDVTASTVKEAIEMASDKHFLTIRINPADIAVIEKSKSSFLETIKGLRRLDIVEDPEIISGGCIVETSEGSVDARLEGQIDEIRKALLGN